MSRTEHCGSPPDAIATTTFPATNAAAETANASDIAPRQAVAVRRIPFGVSGRTAEQLAARRKRRVPVLPDILAPTLSEGEIPTIVKRFSGLARTCLHFEVSRSPVGRFAARAREVSYANGGVRTSSAYEVRRGLHSAVDDLLQDLWMAFVIAVRRGKVRAADAAIRGWIRTTACFISHGTMAGAPFVLACTGAPVENSESDDEAQPGAPKIANVNERPAVPFVDPNAFLAAFRAREPSLLKEVDWEIIERRTRGDAYCMIAANLGMDEGAARVRCKRGRSKLRAALFPANDIGNDKGGAAA